MGRCLPTWIPNLDHQTNNENLQNILRILTIIKNILISKSYYFRSKLPIVPNNLQECKLKNVPPPKKKKIHIIISGIYRYYCIWEKVCIITSHFADVIMIKWKTWDGVSSRWALPAITSTLTRERQREKIWHRQKTGATTSEREIEVIRPQIKDCRQPQETRRGKNGLFPRESWGTTFLALWTLRIWAQWYRFPTWPPKSWENKFLLF